MFTAWKIYKIIERDQIVDWKDDDEEEEDEEEEDEEKDEEEEEKDEEGETKEDVEEDEEAAGWRELRVWKEEPDWNEWTRNGNQQEGTSPVCGNTRLKQNKTIIENERDGASLLCGRRLKSKM